jgi:hypothetical protein
MVEHYLPAIELSCKTLADNGTPKQLANDGVEGYMLATHHTQYCQLRRELAGRGKYLRPARLTKRVGNDFEVFPVMYTDAIGGLFLVLTHSEQEHMLPLVVWEGPACPDCGHEAKWHAERHFGCDYCDYGCVQDKPESTTEDKTCGCWLTQSELKEKLDGEGA